MVINNQFNKEKSSLQERNKHKSSYIKQRCDILDKIISIYIKLVQVRLQAC